MTTASTSYRNTIPFIAIAVLMILGIVGKNAGMVVSVLAAGIAFYILREAPRSKQFLVSGIAAVIFSLLSETVHTVYHMMESVPTGSPGDNGGFFLSALLVPIINIAALIIVVILGDWVLLKARKS